MKDRERQMSDAYNVLKWLGHAPSKAAEIALDAVRGDRLAQDWVRMATEQHKIATEDK